MWTLDQIYPVNQEHLFSAIPLRLQGLETRTREGDIKAAKDLVKEVLSRPARGMLNGELFNWHAWLGRLLYETLNALADPVSMAQLATQTAAIMGDQDLLLHAQFKSVPKEVLESMPKVEVAPIEEMTRIAGEDWDRLIGAPNPAVITKRWARDLTPEEKLKHFQRKYGEPESEDETEG